MLELKKGFFSGIEIKPRWPQKTVLI